VPRIRLAAAVAAAAVLVLSGCATASTPPAAEPTAGAGATAATFPVSVEHVYGTTTIPAQPERIATVAWANHEVPLALGIVPVGMSKATWGDDDGDGVLPWVEDRLTALGADTPVLFDETDGIPFDQIADTRPDVILAAYSGLSRDDYDMLSKIAPVVAYPDVPWGTSYEDMIRLNATAIGLADEGDALVEDLRGQVRSALDAQEGLAGATVLFSYLDPADLSQIGFYTSHDTRPGFLESLGMPAPTVVTEESAKTEEFYTTVSAEQADRFADVDVFVTYGEADGAIVAALQADPLLSQIPAIAEGRIAVLQNNTPLAASANPSPLSIGWGIDEYFALLGAAVTGTE